jgi:hypothetical protein
LEKTTRLADYYCVVPHLLPTLDRTTPDSKLVPLVGILLVVGTVNSSMDTGCWRIIPLSYVYRVALDQGKVI